MLMPTKLIFAPTEGSIGGDLASTDHEIVILDVRLDDPETSPFGPVVIPALGADEMKWFANAMLDALGRDKIISRSIVKGLGHNQPAACTPTQLGTVPSARVILRWSSGYP